MGSVQLQKLLDPLQHSHTLKSGFRERLSVAGELQPGHVYPMQNSSHGLSWLCGSLLGWLRLSKSLHHSVRLLLSNPSSFSLSFH